MTGNISDMYQMLCKGYEKRERKLLVKDTATKPQVQPIFSGTAVSVMALLRNGLSDFLLFLLQDISCVEDTNMLLYAGDIVNGF